MPRGKITQYRATLKLTASVDYGAKALANYLFREIIEEAHTKYGITEDDVKAMTKQAVNRAACYLQMVNDGDEEVTAGLLTLMAPYIHKWDDPEQTLEVCLIREEAEKQAALIRGVKGKLLYETQKAEIPVTAAEQRAI